MEKSKKIVFVSDFFKENLLGGAEANDSVLISFLEQSGYIVEKCLSGHFKVSKYNDSNVLFIISNFINLAEVEKNNLFKREYIIYEHDHKYIKTRDPSRFENYQIPQDQIINKKFYQNAKAVVVLSKICKEIIESNLSLDNVHNIGTSLWSKEKLAFIRKISGQDKTGIAVLNSSNPTKGTHEAIAFCESRQLTYDLISSQDEKEFLKKLSNFKKLVFMPQVLETFCRLVVEAKMLGCKVITKPNMLGFSSEECYSLDGEDLVLEIEQRVGKAFETFSNLIEGENNDVTAILTCYKRSHLLEEQISTIKKQTVPPKEIWVWVNKPEEENASEEAIRRQNIKNASESHPEIKIFDNNHNWKFFGRFAVAMLAKTEYVVMYDDDTMPGTEWHKNCFDTMREKSGILGGVGCILPGPRYYGHQRIGWSSPNDQTVEVDLVGHSWFFKTEWLKYFWMEQPYTWDNGEDIHFSYVAQKYGNIKTFVPPHPTTKPSMFSSTKGMEYGIDKVATSATRNHKVFYRQRDECVLRAIENGWKIIRSK